jgi:hypothetical protein
MDKRVVVIREGGRGWLWMRTDLWAARTSATLSKRVVCWTRVIRFSVSAFFRLPSFSLPTVGLAQWYVVNFSFLHRMINQESLHRNLRVHEVQLYTQISDHRLVCALCPHYTYILFVGCHALSAQGPSTPLCEFCSSYFHTR